MTKSIFRSATIVAAAALAACGIFDTDVTNPNAIQETALGDPASAPTQANGLNSAVTRMITSVYGPYAVATDELTWVGSREYWGKLDAGDLSDPRNEYADAAYVLASEVRWLSNYTMSRLEGFDQDNSLRNRVDLGRAYIYAAVAYMTIADTYDDFVISSDRTTPAAPVGEANMAQMYDSAIVYLDRALPIVTTPLNAEFRNQTTYERLVAARDASKTAEVARLAREIPEDSVYRAKAAADLAKLHDAYLRDVQAEPAVELHRGSHVTRDYANEVKS